MNRCCVTSARRTARSTAIHRSHPCLLPAVTARGALRQTGIGAGRGEKASAVSLRVPSAAAAAPCHRCASCGCQGSHQRRAGRFRLGSGDRGAQRIDALVDDLAAPLDQPVGVQAQGGARRQFPATVDPPGLAAGHADQEIRRRPPAGRAGVGHAQDGRQVAGTGQLNPRPESGLITAHNTVARTSGSKYCTFRSSRSSISAGIIDLQRVGAQRTAHPAHDHSGPAVPTGHITDHHADRTRGQPEYVVPVAAHHRRPREHSGRPSPCRRSPAVPPAPGCAEGPSLKKHWPPLTLTR